MKTVIRLPLIAMAAIAALQPLAAKSEPTEPPAATPASPLEALKWMDGQWRGKAWVLTRAGRLDLTQTERSGTMLDGAVRVVEGGGYDAQGKRLFNALGVIAVRGDGTLEMHSWAQGQAGVFPIEVRPDGFSWSIPAGPATIRYEATYRDGRWVEHGQRLVPGQPPLDILHMELERIGESAWPAAGAVPAR